MSRVFQFPDVYQLKRAGRVNKKYNFNDETVCAKLLQLTIKFDIKLFLKFIATFTQGAINDVATNYSGFVIRSSSTSARVQACGRRNTVSIVAQLLVCLLINSLSYCAHCV